LHALQLGNVLGDARQADDAAGILTHREYPVADPADRPIGPHDAVDIIVPAVTQPPPQHVLETGAVVGMDRVQPGFRGLHQALAAAVPDSFVGGTDVFNTP